MSDQKATASASSMEQAADQYAFYVHQAGIAKDEARRLKEDNDRLEARNSQVQADITSGQTAMTELQLKLKSAAAELKSYEDRESEKLERMKAEATEEIKKSEMLLAEIKVRKEASDKQEQEVRRGEFQVRATLEDLTIRKADVEFREKQVGQREAFVSESEVRIRQLEGGVRTREQAVLEKEQANRKMKESLDLTQQSFDRKAAELNEIERDLIVREGQLKIDKEQLEEKRKAIIPYIELYKEFRTLAIQYAGDDEKILAWLSDHAAS